MEKKKEQGHRCDGPDSSSEGAHVVALQVGRLKDHCRFRMCFSLFYQENNPTWLQAKPPWFSAASSITQLTDLKTKCSLEWNVQMKLQVPQGGTISSL